MADIAPTRADAPAPDVQAFLDTYEAMDLPELHELSPTAARDLWEQVSGIDPGIDLPTVEDRTVDADHGEIPVRVYDSRETPGGKRPLVVYLHGGGWVVGSIDTHDGVSRKLAAETGYPVLSVGYRLAPEQPFPAGLTDCYRALEWAAETAPDLDADPNRLVLAGDSAGGNLAAATAMLARDRGGPDVAHQVLVYPATGDPRPTRSYEENGEGYFLTQELSEWFADHYLEEDLDRGNVYAQPRLAADLTDLPPATVLTAGFDPLRDDGAAYARRLREADVAVSYKNFDDQIHGFFNMIGEPISLEGAHAAHEWVAADLREALEG